MVVAVSSALASIGESMTCTYPVTVDMGQARYCTACQRMRVIYVMVDQVGTQAPVRMTCYATCSRILEQVKEEASA